MHSTLKKFKFALSLLCFGAIVFLAQSIISKSIENQANKHDYAEINHIKYGLFSVNEWKNKLEGIITDEIEDFDLTNSNRSALKRHVEKQLDVLIDKVEDKIRETNKGTTKGWLKQKFLNAFVDVRKIKEGIPQYADAIVQQMTKKKTETAFKDVVQNKVEEYFEKTFEQQDLTKISAIVAKFHATDVEDARVKVATAVSDLRDQLKLESWAIILLAALLFAMAWASREPLAAGEYFILLFTLGVLLAVGVSTPMIDMEAKISEMSFTLFDHPVSFKNQILYFQTKSVLDVFWIMITNSDIQMKIVGILMVSFSIVFPLTKMFCSLLYFYDWRGARNAKWVHFFVMKSGKWSMTDVLIVAIFMAYIGFNGIINSQFGNFSSNTEEIVLLTTNGTSLQSGFYVFVTYAVLAMFLSELLTRRPSHNS